MKNKFDILITVASWEHRFLSGTKKNVNDNDIGSIYCFSNLHNPHPIETEANVQKLQEVNLPHLKRFSFDFGSTIETWQKLQELIVTENFGAKKILFDITTCPRDLIWYILYSLRQHKCQIHYIYHKPATYPTKNDWLTKDTRRPRFIIKHSGVSEFDRPTGLFIITGFDQNRTEQLINFYEPKFILLGVQESNSLDSDNRNHVLHEEVIKRNKTDIEVFKLNCYEEAESLNMISTKIDSYLGKFNFVMASLGPKPSAIILYKLFLKHPEIALSYARSNEYNKDYSEGIGESCIGQFTED